MRRKFWSHRPRRRGSTRSTLCLCSPYRRLDQVGRRNATMWDAFERFMIDRDVRVVAVDQRCELGDALQIGRIAVARQEQLAASLNDAVALARPDRVHAPDVLDAKDDCDAVAAGCRHDLGQGWVGACSPPRPAPACTRLGALLLLWCATESPVSRPAPQRMARRSVYR